MTLVRDHVSQDASGWTKTGVTMSDGFFSLKINTVVGTNLHYVWDHAGSLTLPSSGRCTLSITISSADVPRIAIGTHPSDTTKRAVRYFRYAESYICGLARYYIDTKHQLSYYHT